MAQAKSDKRLLGAWRSDRRRTMKDWSWPKSMRAERRKRFAALFSHLTVRYTRQRIHTDLKGYRNSQPYEVVASDSDSVAILCESALLGGRRIQHIHFDGDDYYWIEILERQREWFKRVKES